MADIIYRLIKEEDIDDVNTFYNNFHHAGRSKRHFIWEFENCPHGKGIYVLAINLNENKIMGIQAGIPIIVKLDNGIEISTIKSEDSLIDVDACAQIKKTNLFNELYSYFLEKCKERGITCIWGFTWARNSLLRLGFQIPFVAGQALIVLRPNKGYRLLSHLNPHNKRSELIRIGMLTALSFSYGLIKRLIIRIHKLPSFEKGVLDNTELVEKIMENQIGSVFIKQDYAFLKWRLCDNPYPLHYEIYNFHMDSRLVAQIVTSLHPNGQGFIEQALISYEIKGTTAIKMVHSVVNELYNRGASLVRVLTFSHNSVNIREKAIIKSSGFFTLDRGMCFIYLPLVNSSSVLPEGFILSRLYTQGHC
ncbi:MAG: hypothetical protein EOM90_10405 [Alphaproteobacteria bacterium]|nr:hypothetical protein [Alphaproteobacteria bacterium]